MRRPLALMAVLALAGCGGGEPAAPVEEISAPPAPSAEPEPSEEPTEAEPAPSASSSPETATEEPTSEAPRAVPPEVEGEWREHDATPMDTEAAIEGSSLSAGLKAALHEAVIDVVVLNDEYDEEFEDCPVEAAVAGVHPAGFAVASVAGCGPAELTGVYAYADGQWTLAVETSPEPPRCMALADAGVPAGVPYPWDGGQLHCMEGSEQRFW